MKNSGDKAQLYKADQEPEKKKKEAKAAKKAKKAKTEKSCDKKDDKKGCCSGASKCGGEKTKAGSL